MSAGLSVSGLEKRGGRSRVGGVGGSLLAVGVASRGIWSSAARLSSSLAGIVSIRACWDGGVAAETVTLDGVGAVTEKAAWAAEDDIRREGNRPNSEAERI